VVSSLDGVSGRRERQLDEKLRAGSEWQDNNLVFTSSKGTLLEAQNVINKSFKPLLERARLPPIRFHDCGIAA
jgi:integrase